MNEETINSSKLEPSPIIKPASHLKQHMEKYINVGNAEVVNPAEPLTGKNELFKSNDIASTTEMEKFTKKTPGTEVILKPTKKFMKKSQKCLSNLTEEMSITLRQSIACLDDIFMRARQCLSEMEENDRRYQFAKVHKLDLKQETSSTDDASENTNIQTLLPVKPPRSVLEESISDLSEFIMSAPLNNKQQQQQKSPKFMQTDLSLADKIINESLQRLETVCKDMMEFGEYDTDDDDTTNTVTTTTITTLAVETVKNKSKENSSLNKSKKHRKSKDSKEERRKARREGKERERERLKELELERERERERERREERERESRECLKPLSPPSPKELEELRQRRRKENLKDVRERAMSQLETTINMRSRSKKSTEIKHSKSNDKKTRPSSSHSDRSRRSNRTICKCCQGSNCKCGLEVKSFGTDVPQQTKLTWIQKTSEVPKREPEFLDILDDIKLSDVEGFQSEYPRKDHIIPMQRKCVQDTLLYKLVFDKSLNIWDFLLKNRFIAGLRPIRQELLKAEYPMTSKSTRNFQKFKQNSGVSIDRPMSADLANLQMQFHKNQQHPHQKHILKKSKPKRGDSSSASEISSDDPITIKTNLLVRKKSKAANGPKTLMPRKPSAFHASKEFLGPPPKKQYYTVLPMECVYDKDNETTSYKNLVKKVLRPYLVDPSLNRDGDVYTVMPVRVFYDNENVKQTLQNYVYGGDSVPVPAEQSFNVLPVQAVYQQQQQQLTFGQNEEQGSFWEERQHCNMTTKLCQRCENDLLMTKNLPTQKEKMLWQSKFKKSPAENLIKFTNGPPGSQGVNSFGMQQGQGQGQGQSLYNQRNVVGGIIGFPGASAKVGVGRKPLIGGQIPGHRGFQGGARLGPKVEPTTKKNLVGILKDGGRNKNAVDGARAQAGALPKISIPLQPQDMEAVVCNIESRIVAILENSNPNKAEAFTSVEKDINDILATIQKSKQAVGSINTPTSSMLSWKKSSAGDMEEIKEESPRGSKPSSPKQAAAKKSNTSSSTPSIGAERSSKQGSDQGGISKTTLDDVESQVLESFEDDSFPKLLVEKTKDEAEELCKQVENVIRDMKKTTKDIEAVNKKSKLEDPEDFYAERETLFAIKEESSPADSGSSVQKKAKNVNNNLDAKKMHIIDEESTKIDKTQSGRKGSKSPSPTRTFSPNRTSSLPKGSTSPSRLSSSSRPSSPNRTSSPNTPGLSKRVDEAWDKFQQDLAKVKQEENKLRELTQSFKALNESCENLEDIGKPEEMENVNALETVKSSELELELARQSRKNSNVDRVETSKQGTIQYMNQSSISNPTSKSSPTTVQVIKQAKPFYATTPVHPTITLTPGDFTKKKSPENSRSCKPVPEKRAPIKKEHLKKCVASRYLEVHKRILSPERKSPPSSYHRHHIEKSEPFINLNVAGKTPSDATNNHKSKSRRRGWMELHELATSSPSLIIGLNGPRKGHHEGTQMSSCNVNGKPEMKCIDTQISTGAFVPTKCQIVRNIETQFSQEHLVKNEPTSAAVEIIRNIDNSSSRPEIVETINFVVPGENDGNKVVEEKTCDALEAKKKVFKNSAKEISGTIQKGDSQDKESPQPKKEEMIPDIVTPVIAPTRRPKATNKRLKEKSPKIIFDTQLLQEINVIAPLVATSNKKEHFNIPRGQQILSVNRTEVHITRDIQKSEIPVRNLIGSGENLNKSGHLLKKVKSPLQSEEIKDIQKTLPNKPLSVDKSRSKSFNEGVNTKSNYNQAERDVLSILGELIDNIQIGDSNEKKLITRQKQNIAEHKTLKEASKRQEQGEGNYMTEIEYQRVNQDDKQRKTNKDLSDKDVCIQTSEDEQQSTVETSSTIVEDDKGKRYLTPFMQAIQEFRKKDSVTDILTFLDNLKKMSGDQIAIHKHLAKRCKIAREKCVPRLYHVATVYETTTIITPPVPRGCKEVDVISFADRAIIKRPLEEPIYKKALSFRQRAWDSLKSLAGHCKDSGNLRFKAKDYEEQDSGSTSMLIEGVITISESLENSEAPRENNEGAARTTKKYPFDSIRSPFRRTESPGGSSKSPGPGLGGFKDSCGRRKIPEETKRSADESKKISDESKKISDGFKRIYEESKKISDESKKISDESKKISDESKKTSDVSKRNPVNSQRSSDSPSKVSDCTTRNFSRSSYESARSILNSLLEPSRIPYDSPRVRDVNSSRQAPSDSPERSLHSSSNIDSLGRGDASLPQLIEISPPNANFLSSESDFTRTEATSKDTSSKNSKPHVRRSDSMRKNENSADIRRNNVVGSRDDIPEDVKETKPKEEDRKNETNLKDVRCKDRIIDKEAVKAKISKDKLSKRDGSKDRAKKRETSEDRAKKRETSKDRAKKRESSKDRGNKRESSKDRTTKHNKVAKRVDWKDNLPTDESSKNLAAKETKSKDMTVRDTTSAETATDLIPMDSSSTLTTRAEMTRTDVSGSMQSQSAEDCCVQTELTTNYLNEMMLKWPSLQQPMMFSRGCLISTTIGGMPKIICTINDQAVARQMLNQAVQTNFQYAGRDMLVVKVDSVKTLEELIDASVYLNHPLVKVKPAILPVMYGVLFSVMYLGLNFTFSCG